MARKVCCDRFADCVKGREIVHAEPNDETEHQTTKNYRQISYSKPLPEDLVRKIAKYRVRNMGEATRSGNAIPGGMDGLFEFV